MDKISKTSTALAFIAGLASAKGIDVATAQDAVEKFRAQYKDPYVQRLDVYCSADGCYADLHERVEPTKESEAVGVKPEGWVNRVQCQSDVVPYALQLCDATQEEATPEAFKNVLKK